MLVTTVLKETVLNFLNEDDLGTNVLYQNSLPSDLVKCRLKFKSPQLICGLPFFFAVFKALGVTFEHDHIVRENEGMKVDSHTVEFDLPFNAAINGERVALNLLQRASSIATYTSMFVEKAQKYDVKILDTRKTTPGLRFLEKYATNKGGAFNHRFGQTDMWMIKDNHKSFFGGVKGAVDFFSRQKTFYTPLLLEVHTEDELREGLDLGIRHFMLDNFTPQNIGALVPLKKEGVTFEVSGGVNLDNIESFCVEGVDAISIGSITYGAPPVDISLKFGERR